MWKKKKVFIPEPWKLEWNPPNYSKIECSINFLHLLGKKYIAGKGMVIIRQLSILNPQQVRHYKRAFFFLNRVI